MSVEGTAKHGKKWALNGEETFECPPAERKTYSLHTSRLGGSWRLWLFLWAITGSPTLRLELLRFIHRLSVNLERPVSHTYRAFWPQFGHSSQFFQVSSCLMPSFGEGFGPRLTSASLSRL